MQAGMVVFGIEVGAGDGGGKELHQIHQTYKLIRSLSSFKLTYGHLQKLCIVLYTASLIYIYCELQ